MPRTVRERCVVEQHREISPNFQHGPENSVGQTRSHLIALLFEMVLTTCILSRSLSKGIWGHLAPNPEATDNATPVP